jgi:hypothetical protein
MWFITTTVFFVISQAFIVVALADANGAFTQYAIYAVRRHSS